MTRDKLPHAFGLLTVVSVVLLSILLASSVVAQNLADTLQYGTQRQAEQRSQAVQTSSPHMPFDSPRIGSMTPAERRAAIDAYWGDGLSRLRN